MNNKQSEALILADALEAEKWHISGVTAQRAADELRRLHTVNAEWTEKAKAWLASPAAAQRLEGYRDLMQRLNTAEQQRDELLEALRSVMACAGEIATAPDSMLEEALDDRDPETRQQANAFLLGRRAVAKAEEIS